MSITLSPLTDCFGAEVSGIDLRDPIDAATRREIRAALAEKLVLVFHDQDLTPDSLLAAMQALGEPMEQHYSQYNMQGNPLVGTISSKEAAKTEGGKRFLRGSATWHTDHTNHPNPPFATILYGVKMPSTGGDTSFCDMRAAYASLPPEWKAKVDGRETVNVLDRMIDAKPEDIAKYGDPVVHPLVRTHPETGAKALYFHPTKTARIEGMQHEESLAFLDDLMAVSIKPEFTYRHKWRPGDVVMCDNRAALHQAHADYDPEEGRLLYRVVLKDPPEAKGKAA